jgi:hypothetical protein
MVVLARKARFCSLLPALLTSDDAYFRRFLRLTIAFDLVAERAPTNLTTDLQVGHRIDLMT